MLFVVATFALVLLLVLGSYWFFIVRPEQKDQASLNRRLKAGLSEKRAASLGLLKEIERLSAVGPVNAILGRAGALSSPLQRLIDRSGLRLTVGTLVLACGCAAAGGWLLVMLLFRQPLIAAAVAAVLGAVPLLYVRWAANSRMHKFEEHFPEAIDLIARALRAGHAFTTGLGMVAEEAPEPVRTEFRRLYDQQNFGMPLAEAFRAFAQRVPVLDARFFATAVLTQRESGGNLSEVLDNLAAVIRERFRVKRQVRVLSAHGRITGVVLFALPPALGTVLFIMHPKNMMMMFQDPLGVQMMWVAIALQIIGGLTIRKLVRIDY